MANINIAKYSNRPAGIYREIINRAQQPELPFNQARLLIGFSRQGIFNRPVRLNNASEAREIFGKVDTYLEKRGSFFHRSINTALESGPVFALNLRNLNPGGVTDLVDGFSLSTKYGEINGGGDEVELKRLYNTDKFWTYNDDNLQSEVNSASNNLIRFANTRQGTVTAIVVKSDNPDLNVRAIDWYENPDDIPEWMDNNDLISDYSVRVIFVKGSFGPEQYQNLASSSLFGDYFDYDATAPGASGLKKGMVTNFLDLPQVEVIRDFEGSLIPNLRNQDGEDIYITDQINQFADQTGILFNIDEDQFDGATAPINLLGSTEVVTEVNLLSYIIDDPTTLSEDINLFAGDVYGAPAVNTQTEFFIEYQDLPDAWIDLTTYNEGEIVENNNTFYIAINTHTASSTTEPGVGADWETEWDVYTGSLNATPRVKKGDLFLSAAGGSLVRATEVVLAEEGSYVSKVSTEQAVDITMDSVTRYTPVANAATHIQGFALQGFEMTAAHMPDGSWSSIRDTILNVLTDTNIGNAIADKDANSFRYLVDTFGKGIDANSKSVFTQICRERQNMFALINAPSMEDFRSSTNPSFKDPFGNLSSQLISEGGAEGSGTFNFTLPGEAQGAYFGAYFGPHLVYQEGNSEKIVPPAAAVSNLFVQKYQTAEPWTIVAGNDWSLSGRGIVGVEYELDSSDRKYFENIGINPIVFKRNQGLVIDGNMTAKQSPKSPLSSINGIEVVIYIQDQLEAILSNYQWRFNDEQTRLEIKQLADQALDSVLAAGGIFDYENVMDRSNNTDEVIDNELGVLTTYLEIARGMKILVNPLVIYRTGGIQAAGVTTA